MTYLSRQSRYPILCSQRSSGPLKAPTAAIPAATMMIRQN